MSLPTIELDASGRSLYDLIIGSQTAPGNPAGILRSFGTGYKAAENFLVQKALEEGTGIIAQRNWCLDDKIQEATTLLAKKGDYTTGNLKGFFEGLPEQARRAAETSWAEAELVVADYDARFPIFNVLVKMNPTRGWANITLPYAGANNEVGLAFYQSWMAFLGRAKELGYQVKEFDVTKKIPYKHAQIKGSIDYKALQQAFVDSFEEVGRRARLNIELENMTSFFDYNTPAFRKTKKKE